MRYALFAMSITVSIVSAWLFRSNTTILKGWLNQPGAPYVAAQGFVRQGLERPETAFFPTDFTAVQTSPKRWAVWSYVDSQDRFGSMIRTTWKVELVERLGSYGLVGYARYESDPIAPAANHGIDRRPSGSDLRKKAQKSLQGAQYTAIAFYFSAKLSRMRSKTSVERLAL